MTAMEAAVPGSPREYRAAMEATGLVSFRVVEGESDLHISAIRDLSVAASWALSGIREKIREHIRLYPEFLSSLEPLARPSGCDGVVSTMYEASTRAGVGPMAAVAGAVAEAVGRDLLALTNEVIVENGGDVFVVSATPRMVAVYAGSSPFSMRVAIELPACPLGAGVCTSSGTIGHSLSFGRADAVTVLADDAALADAWATRIGNQVKTARDVESALLLAQEADGVRGALVVIGDSMGAWGEITLKPYARVNDG